MWLLVNVGFSLYVVVLLELFLILELGDVVVVIILLVVVIFIILLVVVILVGILFELFE